MAQKRKLTESKVPEVPELIKSSKLEITEAKKKALTKNEITIKFNTLLLKHEELLKAHQESLQKIDHLEKEIESKKTEKREKVVSDGQKNHIDVQTDDSETCNECEYPAKDIWELGEHIYEYHTLKDHGEFACTFCYEKFGRKRDLMVQRKNYHQEVGD